MEWDINIKISNILDISIIAFILYFIFVWFKKTRAAFVLIGLVIAGVIYLLARQFNLALTTQIFQSVLAVVLVGLIVIFQQEIRYFFEQLAVWSLNQKLGKKGNARLPLPEAEVLVKTLFDFTAERIGALVVIRGKDALSGYVDGGIDLNGRLSEHILKSIFDPHSIGHDGAVIIEGDKVLCLSAHLPLSKASKKLGYGGTRHAAALGLAEVTDALCLVVSEERGVVSFARKGTIQKVEDVKELTKVIEAFYAEINPIRKKNTWKQYLRKNSREKIGAIAVAATLWFVQVYSAELIYKNFDIPVRIVDLPDYLDVSEKSLEQVTISFTGPRRAFYWVKKNDIRLRLDAATWKKGERSILLADSDMTFPSGLVLRSISPRSIKVKIESQPNPE